MSRRCGRRHPASARGRRSAPSRRRRRAAVARRHRRARCRRGASTGCRREAETHRRFGATPRPARRVRPRSSRFTRSRRVASRARGGAISEHGFPFRVRPRPDTRYHQPRQHEANGGGQRQQRAFGPLDARPARLQLLLVRGERRIRGPLQRQTDAHAIGIHQIRRVLDASFIHMIGDALFQELQRHQRFHRLVVGLRRGGRGWATSMPRPARAAPGNARGAWRDVRRRVASRRRCPVRARGRRAVTREDRGWPA